MKPIASFSYKRTKSGQWTAGYYHDNGKCFVNKNKSIYTIRDRKFIGLKVFGTMEEAAQYCREQEDLCKTQQLPQ
ncbi:hypothetical protein PL75_03400 [Neisseria arctica]|uniref:AP2/ERF domain-containing protein n=1 Tax=Neisseria arctica TaxID=1470200 RepID=A0A0J0YSZ5_9NEIS|nr:hypothetical protein [Neisseria arctica]KLT73280.1 hypothetical protein PL75_03400 [Neisseria arctica]UOO87461.1 hypothetical protein LVJ86_04250 [Neisseria arctica]